MSKATVTKLFFGAILALALALIVSLAAVIAALAGGAVHLGGPDIVAIDGAAIVGALPLVLMAALLFIVGELAAVGSWIGALLNTWPLKDKVWFVGLLVLGLLSLAWLAMIAYIVAGPDGMSVRVPRSGVATTPGT